MAEQSLIFPRAEYQTRLHQLQIQMEEDGLAVLLLTTPADIFYVTGFLTRFWESPARPWFVVIPAKGDPVAVIPSIGADLMGRTWMTDIRTWTAPNPYDDGISLLADTITALSPQHSRIGVPMGPETHLRMPLADYAELSHQIGARHMADATHTVQRVREIKSAAEVAKIRASCAIAARAFDRVPDFARAGQGLDAVFRAFQIALLQEGADWVSYVAGGAGPGGYGDVISPARQTPLQPGDILMLDTGAVRDGYFCDFDRNYSIGPANDTAKHMHRTLWHATEHALQTLRPDMRAADAHRLMADVITREGFAPAQGRLGHGLGVALTEWPSFTPQDQTVLRDGMVLTLEPGIFGAGGVGMVHEENILLTQRGPELLSPRAPKDLPEI
ncbi:putative peptidase [Tritonibacter multivorans]|uniref:Putative peptidase n=1 Tax=Tritonibacter multivorans TaxID=928856 RepID=A0A0P1GMQ5_9RHOB|nr:Xaa-Pro peptidase family protein [Tritonibacter multivorans]MDA7421914.1 Xaa-Pro peptidase family protein [Tritonibacter multivorans]CUH76600.1 putative peptidase [Tritonibacter multivorans]SFD47805.1 Xaa-Pro aminopeptidase [Tritonibacter multivorans]